MYKFISSPEYESTIVADIPDSNYLCYIYGHSMSVSIDSGVGRCGYLDYEIIRILILPIEYPAANLRLLEVMLQKLNLKNPPKMTI